MIRGAEEAAPEAERLRRESERIGALLEEVSSTAAPQTWQRVEELVHRLVTLYGAGFERLLAHAARAGAEPEGLCEDALLESLLLLHGLHPWPAEDRVRRALSEVRPYLGSHAGGVELVELTDDTVRLRLVGSCRGCPSSRVTIEHTLRRAVEEAAPEIAHIEVEGAEASPSDGSTLVQLGGKPAPARRWQTVSALRSLLPGTGLTLSVRGVPILALRVGQTLLAYESRCGACGGELDPRALDGVVLECGCGLRYDVLHGGRSVAGTGPHLRPLPLLVDGDGARVALPATEEP